jgi:alpha-glucosidase
MPRWRSAVVYQVYLRSFADSDGDGSGDVVGLRSRLPYLRDLGVDAVWVNPWYPSPLVDGGYDVADYRAVDPRFGTLADAEDLLDGAHRLGLRVLLDIVPGPDRPRHPEGPAVRPGALPDRPAGSAGPVGELANSAGPGDRRDGRPALVRIRS